jgi:hypothetical protein
MATTPYLQSGSSLGEYIRYFKDSNYQENLRIKEDEIPLDFMTLISDNNKLFEGIQKLLRQNALYGMSVYKLQSLIEFNCNGKQIPVIWVINEYNKKQSDPMNCLVMGDTVIRRRKIPKPIRNTALSDIPIDHMIGRDITEMDISDKLMSELYHNIPSIHFAPDLIFTQGYLEDYVELNATEKVISTSNGNSYSAIECIRASIKDILFMRGVEKIPSALILEWCKLSGVTVRSVYLAIKDLNIFWSNPDSDIEVLLKKEKTSDSSDELVSSIIECIKEKHMYTVDKINKQLKWNKKKHGNLRDFIAANPIVFFYQPNFLYKMEFVTNQCESFPTSTESSSSNSVENIIEKERITRKKYMEILACIEKYGKYKIPSDFGDIGETKISLFYPGKGLFFPLKNIFLKKSFSLSDDTIKTLSDICRFVCLYLENLPKKCADFDLTLELLSQFFNEAEIEKFRAEVVAGQELSEFPIFYSPDFVFSENFSKKHLAGSFTK